MTNKPQISKCLICSQTKENCFGGDHEFILYEEKDHCTKCIQRRITPRGREVSPSCKDSQCECHKPPQEETYKICCGLCGLPGMHNVEHTCDLEGIQKRLVCKPLQEKCLICKMYPNQKEGHPQEDKNFAGMKVITALTMKPGEWELKEEVKPPQEDKKEELNQCDGCMAKLPLLESGKYHTVNGRVDSVCQKSRYSLPQESWKERFDAEFKDVLTWIKMNCKDEIILGKDINHIENYFLVFISQVESEAVAATLTLLKSEIEGMLTKSPKCDCRVYSMGEDNCEITANEVVREILSLLSNHETKNNE